MAGIITLQVGGAGANLGNMFWDTIRLEHGLDEQGIYHGSSHLHLQYADVYLENINNRRHIPRTMIIDTDSDSWRQATNNWPILSPDSIITAQNHSANVFTRGYLPDRTGPQVQEAMQRFRQMQERAESKLDTQFIHAIGGGTGSGTCSAIQEQLHDADDKIKIINWTVLPSPLISDKVIEPYNAILSVPSLIDNSHTTYVIDNEALSRILASRVRGGLHQLNTLASLAMVNTTAGVRFPGQQNADWRKIHVNIVPYPRLHFLTLSVSPLNSSQASSVDAMISSMFHTKHLFTSTVQGHYIASYVLLRGRLSMSDIDTAIARVNKDLIKRKLAIDSVARAVCDIPPPNFTRSGVMCANHTGIAYALKRILAQFTVMFKKKAFVHWYDGFEEHDFLLANNATENIIEEYLSAGKEINAGGAKADDAIEEW